MKSVTYFLAPFLLACLSLSSCDRLEISHSSGLILYYTFDGNIIDGSGNNNNGKDSTSDNYVSGRWAQALDFNGKSDYIQLSRTINSENGLSFSFWVKTRGVNSNENNGVIVSKYNMTTHLRSFMIYSFGAYDTRGDNRLSAAFYKNRYSSSKEHDHIKSYMEENDIAIFPDPSLWTIIKPRRLETEVWTHCVINVTETHIEAWINGELCAKKQREYSTYFDSPDQPVFIGNTFAGGEGNNNHFNGALDELRIYNRGLSNKEIQILYKSK